MSAETLLWLAACTRLAFFFALGAIVGSFVNVLVYRLPRGLNVVVPASRCPRCETKLKWFDNLPIVGWTMVRGRCRYCGSRISPEYPIVELTVALLFAGAYLLWFMEPSPVRAMGIDVGAIRPDWTRAGFDAVWPTLLITFTLLGSLVAATLIDARTFTIPLSLPWTAAIVGALVHPLHALWIQSSAGGLRRVDHAWTIPLPEWPWLLAALGATLGVGASLLLLRFGVIRRSFGDEYEAWEREATARLEEGERSGEANDLALGGEPPPVSIGETLLRVGLLTGPAIALMFVGFAIGLPLGAPMQSMLIGMAVGLVIGLPLRRVVGGRDEEAAGSEEPVWLSYPHVQREIWREMLFLALPLFFAGAALWGGVLGAGAGGALAEDPPLWLAALGGSLLGALVGGASIWAVRIGGSLAFGKEAMGLGDVHLMIGVGACLGWVDPLLAFFVAPFFGLAWAALSVVASRVARMSGTALPFGPHLALATIVIIYARPGFEALLTLIAGRPIDLP